MADSTKNKDKKTLDALADDLDAMLNVDAVPVPVPVPVPAAQQVGEIEDDDAIDRLLIGDNFQHVEAEAERDEFADIDALIGDGTVGNRKVASEIDEFGDDIDDMIANIQVTRPQTEPDITEIDEFADIEEDAELVKSIDEVTSPELVALGSVSEIDEFADEFAEEVPSTVVPDIQQDEIKGMNEIDEFSEQGPSSARHADFLIADFDISSGEDIAKPETDELSVDEFGDEGVEIPSAPAAVAAAVAAASASGLPEFEDEFSETETEPVKAAPAAAVTDSSQARAEHDAEIAALTNQIAALKKQQQIFKLEMAEKAGKDELRKCQDDITGLQGEQRKTKRAVDAVGSNKPIGVYVANGLAVAALLIGTGLGFQGYIAKSQIGELVPIIGKLQDQINTGPAGNAGDAESLRKRLDELTAASTQANSQIAEINKALQVTPGAENAGGNVSKQFADLSNQNMQMGAAIEALQNKISALEKSRAATAAPQPKPEKKKPAAVAENWAVNLIAFKQDWYAKRKAEEFAAKGVPAKVIKTESKGENWYRLFVDGFKSQYEAAGYAAKVKKTLNLDSVWVTRSKE